MSHKIFDNNLVAICKTKVILNIPAYIGMFILELKPEMYSFLLDDNSEHIKAKRTNRNIVTTIRRNEYKDVLLNNKCLRHKINRIQSKDHRIGPYKINKILLSCFDD